jgi:hypothetical protein
MLVAHQAATKIRTSIAGGVGVRAARRAWRSLRCRALRRLSGDTLPYPSRALARPVAVTASAGRVDGVTGSQADLRPGRISAISANIRTVTRHRGGENHDKITSETGGTSHCFTNSHDAETKTKLGLSDQGAP